MPFDNLRALVVDDSALYRKVVRTVLEEIPGVEVIGAASNGRVAMEMAQRLAPDFLTLDLEMPELDGLGFLREARSLAKAPCVVMLSSLTANGARVTTEALKLGAFDFILKPQASDLDTSLAQIREQLIPKVQACRFARSARGSATISRPARQIVPPTPPPILLPHVQVKPRDPQVLAIGISTGGPVALTDLLPRLGADFPLPILIVQHMPPMFTKNLAEDLDSRCRLTVREAQGGEVIRTGNIYLAPGGKQMKLEAVGVQRIVRINDDPTERSCRPSVDYLFRSLAHVCGRQTIGLVMTGMGDDGLLGCKLLKRQGALILAQSRESCVVYGMPKCVVDEGLAEETIALKDLADRLTKLANPRGVALCQ